MPENPKISAILPCFNHAQFLEERIESVLGQTHPVDQIVFLDDASIDGSADLASKLLARFPGDVDYCINTINSGSPFAQWNAGVSRAKHDLIWIAETDDSCDSRLIQKLYVALVNSGAVLGYAQSRYTGDDGRDLGSVLSYTDRLWPNAFRDSFLMDGAQFNWLYMVGLNAIPNASAVLFRKDAFLSAGSANDGMRFCGDWDAWIRICAKGKVIYISDELNYFRCHPSTSRASGYTPNAAAEYFACRLVACIKRNNTELSSFTATDLIMGLFNPRDRWQWHQVVQSLDLDSLPEARSRYLGLPNIPVLSEKTWLILQAIYLSQDINGRFASLYKKLMRILYRSLRMLFGYI
jgi:glycosyltransferase involved in cell wall biosynthesis